MVGALRVLAGRYRLIEPIGRGGMSVVWWAHDEVLRRGVAVKLLAAELRDEAWLRAEAQAAALLNHPNVTAVYDYGVAGEEPFVVMELLDGISLADQLTHGALPWRRAVEVCAFVAAALSAAHARGLVHRDIKPGNIMLTRAGVKVVDFGIAAFAGSPADGPVVGTLGYVAPERFTGELGGPAADVYALGVVLFAALVGQKPAGATWELYGDLDAAPLRTIPGMPGDVVALYQECVAADPGMRPSAAALARRFAALAGVRVGAVDGDPLAEEPPPAPPRRAFAGGRAPVRAVIAGAGVAAVGVAGAFVALTPGRAWFAGTPRVPCSVAYQVTKTWANGATVALSIANTGTTDVKEWTLSFTAAEGLRVRSGWNGTWRQHGTHVTVTATPDNAHLAPGMASVGIGTNVDGRDATSIPHGFALNGMRCRTGNP